MTMLTASAQKFAFVLVAIVCAFAYITSVTPMA